jgi:hypothetical protein
MDFLNHREGDMVFLQSTDCRNCKRLREFEEIEFSRKSCIGDCEKQGGKLSQTFVWISSKNSASGSEFRVCCPSPSIVAHNQNIMKRKVVILVMV